MEIKLNEGVKTVNNNKGKVVVSANPKRVRELLDKDGNVIDMRTKQIIRPAEQQ